LRVAAIQSAFIPWRGFFDFIASADIFVFYDDVQYSTGSWRSRNKVKTPKGAEWITVPVRRERLSQLITETLVDDSRPWRSKHMATWSANYRAAPHYSVIVDLLADLKVPGEISISQLNIKLIRRICEYLKISTPMMLSSELALEGQKTVRLIDMLMKLKGSIYLSGPSADAYLDKELFRVHGIQLEYKSYDYEPYPQLWGEFEGAVSILDLIANCGPLARQHIFSKSPNQIVVEGS
jgi:hypothetical protein